MINIKIILFILFSTLIVSCSNTQNLSTSSDFFLSIDTPESQNMQSRLLKAAAHNVYELNMATITPNIQHAKKYTGIESMLIARNNKLVFERYFNGATKDKSHFMASLGKSIISALVGIAIDKGYIKSENESIYKHILYPTYDNWDDKKKSITIEHLLTMTSGWDCGDISEYDKHCGQVMIEQEDPYKWVLDLPMAGMPGEVFNYNDAIPKFLMAILTLATKQNVHDFYQTNIMTPLNIRNNIFLNHKMTSRDMLKFGILYNNMGRWDKQQIISQAWIKKSISRKVTFAKNSQTKGYGYLWWEHQFISSGRKYDSFYAAGNGGQYIIVIPELELVAVFTGSNYNDMEYSRQALDIMQRYVIPSIDTLTQ